MTISTEPNTPAIGQTHAEMNRHFQWALEANKKLAGAYESLHSTASKMEAAFVAKDKAAFAAATEILAKHHTFASTKLPILKSEVAQKVAAQNAAKPAAKV